MTILWITSVELMSMLLVISDQAHYHPRPAEESLEGLTRKHDTKEFQMAFARAHNFLGISSFGGVPLQAIAGGCLFGDANLEGEDIQFPWQDGNPVLHRKILCQFNEIPTGVRQPQDDDFHISR